MLLNPVAYGGIWVRAARRGSDFVRDALAPARSERAWEQAVMRALAPLSQMLG